MKKLTIISSLAAIPVAAFIATTLSVAMVSCNSNSAASAPATDTASATPGKAGLIKKGEYLVTTMGCNDCHSPKRIGPNGPENIPELMLGGHPGSIPAPFSAKATDTALTRAYLVASPTFTSFSGAWGISFAANITSDPTGIGGWTLDRFSKALREGKYHGLEGTRPLLPPMPWFNYIKLKDADLEAIFAYLQSVPPVKNQVPQPQPPAPLAQK